MVRWVLALCVACATLTLRADGDTQDLLTTPEKLSKGELVPNTNASTIQFGNTSDPRTEERPDWTGVGEKACYARITGVGLGAKTETGAARLRKSFWSDGPDPAPRREIIRCVEVVCGAESKSSRGKPHVLTLETDAGTFERAFTVKDEGAVTVNFVFDAPIETTTLTFANASDSGTFEIRRVIWSERPRPIQAEVSIGGASAGGTLICSVTSCSGGSGAYSGVAWTFNGNTKFPVNELYAAVTFPVPDSGTHPLTLEVTDSAGTKATFTYAIDVTPYIQVSEPTVQDVTHTGFTLTWERPASGASAQRFSIRLHSAADFSATLRPTWENRMDYPGETAWRSAWIAVGEELGDMTVDTTILSLPKGSPKVTRVEVQTALLREDSNLLEYGAWTSLNSIIDGIWSPFILEPGQYVRFTLTTGSDVAAEALPRTITLSGLADREYETREVEADGQTLRETFTGLPPGADITADITIHYRDDAQSVESSATATASVTLLPVPIPQADVKGQRLSFKWDESLAAEKPTIELTFYASTPVATDLPPGLYLSRAFHDGSRKGIALTNTSDSDIPLDNTTYFLTKTTSGGKESAKWGFYVKDEEGKNVYTLVVPAHGEVFLSYATKSQTPIPGTIGTTGTPLNFADGATLTLHKESDPVHQLTIVEGTVTRLKEDSLESEHLPDDDAHTAFFEPWGQPKTEERIYRPAPFAYGHPYIDLFDTFTPPETATAFRVELRMRLFGALSEPLCLDVFRPDDPAPPAHPGYRLRLR